MNRDIEFRAWLRDEKKMITKISSIKLDINCIYYDNNQMFSYERASFDEIELMQYTGLKDKNDVKIFEGDIVKTVGYHHSTPHKIEETLFVVVWSFTHWVLQKKLKTGGVEETLLGDEDDEVIGNIYENPELLEVS